MSKLAVGVRTGKLPRLITENVLWTGGCLDFAYGKDMIHSHMSAFVIKGSKKTAIVDTGNPYHIKEVFQAVKEFLDGRPLDYVFPTHFEFPHAGLLPNWMDEYPNATLVGDLPETDLYYPEYVGRLKLVKPGESIDLGDRKLAFVPAVWRDINTLWGFDTKDRVLFVSDAFSYLHYHRPGECDHVTSEEDIDPKLIQFSNEITLKWSRYSDANTDLSDIDKLMQMLDPAFIAPCHGLVVDHVKAMVPSVKAGIVMGTQEVGAGSPEKFG